MKKLLTILLLISMLVGVLGFATACNKVDDPTPTPTPVDPDKNQNGNDNTDYSEDYTVTVVDIEGNPIQGVSLKYTYGSRETEVLTTDAEGKAVKALDTADEVVVEFTDLKGYGNPDKRDRKFKTTSLTITLPVVVTVTATDENGNGLSDVIIQVCYGTSCLTPAPTDTDGVLQRSVVSTDSLKVAVVSVPDGYKIPEKIDTVSGIDVHAYFAEGELSVTIVIPNA